MLSVEEALRLVLQRALPKRPVKTSLLASLGRVLAQDVVSDIDSPPHDKAIVDGYALISADLLAAGSEFQVIEEITAGTVPTRRVAHGQAARIMTGAPVPGGADTIVMVERTSRLPLPNGRENVRITGESLPGENIARRGTSISRGQVALAAGAPIRPIEIGILAEVGQEMVPVVDRPQVSVLATGNELVPCSVAPAAGQIRNSNGPMLLALGERAGAQVVDLGIARDDRNELADLITHGFSSDVLLLSGGVSAGALDLAPATLEALGVEQVFHKVNLKPGKPLWFGVRNCPGEEPTLVFGLPGNPVSSLVCFELFVRPAIARLAGHAPQGLARRPARLGADFKHRGNRPTYHPARTDVNGNIMIAEPVPWQGSGDLRSLAQATGLIHFPAGDGDFAKGQMVEVLLL